MLDAKQLEDIERSMSEQHRLDIEALQRLKRFVSNGKNGSNGAKPTTQTHPPRKLVSLDPSTFTDDSESAVSGTIRAKVQEIFESDPTKRWTVPLMVEYLQSINYPLEAEKPAVSIGGIFRLLHRKRGVIRLVRRGHGRNPNVFRLATKEEGTEKTEEK